MPKKANKAKRGKDKYYHLAKEQGYRARSAFKLIQLNKKYDFLSKATALVDLCAAPGGWCQVAAKYMPSNSVIIGVDLMPIKPIRGVITHQEDITTPECRSLLKRDLGGRKVDVVLHDGAPNVGQNWLKDAFGQSELVLHSLKLACEFLRPHGLFITKVFRSADYNSLLWVLHHFFAKVEATKPHSSRNASAEIFVVCRDYKAPDKIDSRMFDIKHVFKELEDSSGTATGIAGGGGLGTLDVMHSKNDRVRQREGYDESLGVLLTRRVSVVDFVRSHDPVRLLTDVSTLLFDEKAKELGYTDHEATSEEVRACCEDLKVIGKKEFKTLLRWRLIMRTEFPKTLKEKKGDEESETEEESEAGSAEESASEIDSDVEISKEISLAAANELSKRKRELKKAARVRAQALRRIKLGMHLQNIDILDDDPATFSTAKLLKLAGGDRSLLDSLVDGEMEEDLDLENENDKDIHISDASSSDDGLQSEDEAVEAALESGDVLKSLKSRQSMRHLDDLEAEIDTNYARQQLNRARAEEHAREVAESGKASHGIKLSRRTRLERQALLTEASLNKQLDKEHERYLRLLGGMGDSATASSVDPAVALELQRARRVMASSGLESDSESGAESDGSFDSQLSGDADELNEDDNEEEEDDEEEDVQVEERPRRKGLSSEVKANRWFSQDIFTAGAAKRVREPGAEEDEDAELTAMIGEGEAALKRVRGSEESKGNAKKSVSVTQSKAPLKDDSEVVEKNEKPSKKARTAKKDADDDMEYDSDGYAYPDFMKDLPISDREKRKAKLKKEREKEERKRQRASEGGIELISGGKSLKSDVDAEFEEIARMAGATKGGFSDDESAVQKFSSRGAEGGDFENETRIAGADKLIRAGMGKSGKKRQEVEDSKSSTFETVPMSIGVGSKRSSMRQNEDDSDSDSDAETDDSGDDPRALEYDSDTHAEMLALGKKMKKHTTAKALVDASYNRYAFSDPSLPAWFAEDENKHFRPQLPLSRTEVEKIKARFRDIAARPIHKVAEARARKKHRVAVQVAKAQRQASTILEDEDLAAVSKKKAIAKAYRNTQIKRPDSVYVVSGKGSKGSAGKGSRTKFVDPRMKKEKRAAKFRAKKQKGRR